MSKEEEEEKTTRCVRCSHLLVKHQESRRPASWRDETGAIIGKKTKECAIDELLAYREQIEKKVVSFAELATKVSDCSSARHGGDLGTFERGAMQKANRGTVLYIPKCFFARYRLRGGGCC